MTTRLVTTVGSDNWRTLEPMLRHYRDLGVDDFHVTLRLTADDDSVREAVSEIMRRFGCRLFGMAVGDDDLAEQEAYVKPRREYPRDWFILAAPDELQGYPVPLRDLVRICESDGFECVYGALVDRIAADGGIAELEPDASLEDQFPLGATVSGVVAGENILKVVVVRGAILVPRGRHIAPWARGCPMQIAAVPVYRYKWHAPLMETLRRRKDDERLLEHLERYGGFDISDPGLRAAPCQPDYPYWDEICTEIVSRVARSAPHSGSDLR